MSTLPSQTLTDCQMQFVASTFSSVDLDFRRSDFDPTTAHFTVKAGEAFAVRGLDRFKTGNLAAALTDFDQSILIDPRNARALKGRAMARHKTGDYKGAFEDLQALLLTVHNRSAQAYRLCAVLRASLLQEPKLLEQLLG